MPIAIGTAILMMWPGIGPSVMSRIAPQVFATVEFFGEKFAERPIGVGLDRPGDWEEG